MKSTLPYIVALSLVLTLTSCFDKNKPNFQYMPNMYESVGYETYQESDLFPQGTAAMLPADNTIPRGWMPYEFDNTIEGKEGARAQESPLSADQAEENLSKGKELYDVYCASAMEQRVMVKDTW
jgi:hypothetical protein